MSVLVPTRFGTESGLIAVLYQAVEIGRAAVDEDGQYCFAVALWRWSLRHANSLEHATDCDLALRPGAAVFRCHGRPDRLDVIPVHSFSRFFRDRFQIELDVRRLAKAGVSLLRDATAACSIRKLTSYHPDIDAISSNYRQWLLSMSSHG